MNSNFIDLFFDKKNLFKNEISGINQFLIENNTRQIETVYDFLQNNKKLLLVNGFMGTGKASLITHCLSCLSEDSLSLRYDCYETTILDDILLDLYEKFQKLSALGKISVQKTKSENFTQKINSYFEAITKPIVIIINSFEEILKSNKPEILDFIFHLCNLPNIKVIIISRVFELPDFDKIAYNKINVLALDKSIFEKFLRHEDCKQVGPLSDELYKHTRGYFFYTYLTMKIMKLRNLNLVDFLDGFSKSFMTFNDFILREALSLVDPVSGHLFRFLTIMRHPVCIKLLKNLQLWNEDKFLFFSDNLLLTRFGEYICLPEYYKIIAENSIPEHVATKLHKGCVDLYNTQLPLKPLERDLLISRQTMRNEIEYHSNFIPKKMFSQSQESDYGKQNDKIQTGYQTDVSQTKEKTEEKIKKMSFIFDDDNTGVLDKIADSIKSFINYNFQQAEIEKNYDKLSLTELMNKAKQEEASFNFKQAIKIYLKALTLKNDEDFYTYLPSIYTKLAFANQNISNWYDAKKYFNMAEEFYKSTGDLEKINEIKYNIANIFYMTFKRDLAQNILNEIDLDKISDNLKIKVINALANLSNNTDSIYTYYKKALEINPVNIDKKVLSELYFKFASINEDLQDEKTALEYYKKCIELDSDPGKNPNLSSAYSNIAMLYDDIGKSDIAIKYFKESLKLDEITKNLNGMYNTSLKLAEIYSSKDPIKATELYKKALNTAKILEEPYYIILSATTLGDFYFNNNENKLALENYKLAYDIAKEGMDKENTEKIMIRIQDIKVRLGEERFNKLEN